jgi:hypothetical protein
MGARLDVQFTEDQSKAIEEMARQLGTNEAGALKTALSLLQAALGERKKDNRLAVVKDGKIIKEIVGISD